MLYSFYLLLGICKNKKDMKQNDLKKEFILFIKSRDVYNIPELHNVNKHPDYTDWLENKLCNNMDTANGLYAINFSPKELIKRFVDSQSDATRLLVEDVEDLVEDWEKWIDNKNIDKSPFFQI